MVGTVSSAIRVWRTLIAFQVAVHTPIADDFDMAQRRAYGVAGSGQAAGTAWAEALQLHTKNRAPWQYAHQAFAHFLEEALERGYALAVDDAILETGHKISRKLKACVFKGGTNEPGVVWSQTRQYSARKGGVHLGVQANGYEASQPRPCGSSVDAEPRGAAYGACAPAAEPHDTGRGGQV